MEFVRAVLLGDDDVRGDVAGARVALFAQEDAQEAAGGPERDALVLCAEVVPLGIEQAKGSAGRGRIGFDFGFVTRGLSERSGSRARDVRCIT